jgi:polar amino acid transport system permease protein
MTIDTKSKDKILTRIPGAEPTTRPDAWWGLVLAVVLIIAALVIFVPDPYRRMLVFVRTGLGMTIYVTVVSFLLVLVVGLFGGMGRLSKNRIINGISSLYVELVRGIPLLVQLFWWYYGVPEIVRGFGFSIGNRALANFTANPIVMAILGLTVCYGAYMSEIYRAGIQSIPKGQMEAARSQGMSHVQAMRYIILPQTVRMILPPVGNEFITLLKDSSLVSVVAVAELFRRTREFYAATFNIVPALMMAALLYLAMTLLSARVLAWLEKRTTFER